MRPAVPKEIMYPDMLCASDPGLVSGDGKSWGCSKNCMFCEGIFGKISPATSVPEEIHHLPQTSKLKEQKWKTVFSAESLREAAKSSINTQGGTRPINKTTTGPINFSFSKSVRVIVRHSLSPCRVAESGLYGNRSHRWSFLSFNSSVEGRWKIVFQWLIVLFSIVEFTIF
ncbi:hypothetical protein TNIN_313181 [Trichonephila inaurata madagascariensis]|uniref:Uncharacterized protein n=1 Tax=Trichonephila inaurata madagascariensis TaxID=2747483 RepID=A0A8X6XF63_9ARAC|nr:hypothetical protein TNIN_313181 [Trichonephila inaurata madagascariensis]